MVNSDGNETYYQMADHNTARINNIFNHIIFIFHRISQHTIIVWIFQICNYLVFCDHFRQLDYQEKRLID